MLSEINKARGWPQQPHRTRSKVLIGIPFGRPQFLVPHQAWTALNARAATCSKYVVRAEYAPTSSLAFNREYLGETALDENCDWLLMIDTDMSYPANLLDILMSRNKDVIGVPYYSGVSTSKGVEIVPVLFDYDEKTDGWIRWKEVKQTELFKVDCLGGGIILMKTKVLEKIAKPWFLFGSHGDRKHIMSEDVWFSKRCTDAGVDIWQDPSFGDDIKHWHVYGYSKKDCTEGGGEQKLPTPT